MNNKEFCPCNRFPWCPCPCPHPCPQPKCHCPRPPELGGISAQLKTASNVYLNNKQAVLFNEILQRTTQDITFNRITGVFCLRKIGTYLVNWDVAVEGTHHEPFIRFSLITGGSTIGSSTLPITVGQLSGTSIINVTNAPRELTLINDTGDIVQLSKFAPVANITITKITN